MLESSDDLERAARDHDWATYFQIIRERAAGAAKEILTAPPPEHTSRDPWPVGFAVPSPARSLMDVAEAAGWLTRVQYSRAAVVCRRKVDGAFQMVMERRHIVAVRLWHAGRGAHAVVTWESQVKEGGKLSWSGSMVKTWKTGEFPAEVVGTKERPWIKALTEWVADDEA